MNFFDKIEARIDTFQRKHHSLAFILAVIKRYNEDKTTYHAALLTYYGFIALFPLLLVATTAAAIIAANAPEARSAITTSLNGYFPVLGAQLTEHVTTIHKSSIPLFIGLALSLYGARGVIDVFRRGVRGVWHETDTYEGFPNAQLRSLGIGFVGFFGLLSAAVLTGVAAGVGHGLPFRVFSIFVNLGILVALFTYLLNACLPHHIPFKQIRSGAISAAVGLVLLQIIGGFILTREFRNLDAVYSYFAISLGLLFWLFLQAQVMYYAVTVTVVNANKLWPRAFTDKNLTEVDHKIAAQKQL